MRSKSGNILSADLRSRLISVAGLLVVSTAVVALSGYLLEVPTLFRPIPGGPATHPLTASVALLLGTVLVATPRSTNRAMIWLSFTALLICVLRITDYVFGTQLHDAVTLFHPTVQHEIVTGMPNQMGINTAMTMLLFAIAQLTSALRLRAAAQFLAYIGLVIPMTSALGHLFELDSFYGQMSMLTTVASLVLGGATLLLTADHWVLRAILSRSMAGQTARWQILASVLLPAVFSFFAAQLEMFRGGQALIALSTALFIWFAITMVSVSTWLLDSKETALAQILEQMQLSNRQTKAALARYSRLYENMHDGFVAFRPDGSIQEANGAFQSIVGHTLDELMKRRYQDLQTDNEDRQRSDELNTQQITKRGYTDWHEISLIHKDGHQVPVNTRLSTIGSSIDDTEGTWAFIIDLTTRKAAEQQRETEQQLLFHSAKLASMGEMLTAIAHQWRQPLNVISGAVGNIGDAFRHGALSEDHLAKQVGIANQNLQYLSSTINDFKDFLKPTSAGSEFLLEDALHDVQGITRAQLADRRINLHIASSCDAITIAGKRAELSQVLIVLINNAKDAILSQQHAGTVAGQIVVSCLQQDGTMRLLIRNNGPRIDPEVVDRIFEPYFSTKDKQNNTGIGLYLARIIIERKFSSQLNLLESDGNGTCFEIAFDKSVVQHMDLSS